MEVPLISVISFLSAILTFFSGFGLGTILLPVFAIFFPVEAAVALTGVVHFTNNLFKAALIGKKADWSVLLRFGLPAFIASFAGAWLLLRLASLPALLQYQLSGRSFEITPVKLIISILLLGFSITELIPSGNLFHFGRHKLIAGGVLSGFFGGLAGIQGAIRSAFLIKSGLSKEGYIATGVLIACLVDISRLSVYVSGFRSSGLYENLPLVISATLSAIGGAFIGSWMLNKITFRFIQALVAMLLILISLLLGVGII
jgi:uncharacterized membrane protein YfcA